MQSVDDAFSVALASKQVDVAPLGQTLVKTYLAKYEQDGATTIAPSGGTFLRGVQWDGWHDAGSLVGCLAVMDG